MISSTDISYTDEVSIPTLLNCPICSKPYIDPVINTDNTTRTCRLCATSTDIIPVRERVLHELLDNLLVSCNHCHVTNLRRGNYLEHKQNHCSQRIVPCDAADLRCLWTGPNVQLHEHLQTCPVEKLRPTFTEILARIGQNQTRNDIQPEGWSQAYEEVRNEAEQLRNERRELQEAIAQISAQLDQLAAPQDVDTNHQIAQLTQILNEQLERNNTLEAEVQELKQLYHQQVTLYNELQVEFERYKKSTNSNTEIQQLQRLFVKQVTLHNELRAEFERSKQCINSDSETQQLKKQYDKLHAEVKQLSMPPPTLDSQENANDEFDSLKQSVHRHDVQIKLLARRKCVIAGLLSD